MDILAKDNTPKAREAEDLFIGLFLDIGRAIALDLDIPYNKEINKLAKKTKLGPKGEEALKKFKKEAKDLLKNVS